MNEILQQLFKAARDQYHPLPDLALERRVLERWREHVVRSQSESTSEADLVAQFNGVPLHIDELRCSSPATRDRHLARLTANGELRRIDRGLYQRVTESGIT